MVPVPVSPQCEPEGRPTTSEKTTNLKKSTGRRRLNPRPDPSRGGSSVNREPRTRFRGWTTGTARALCGRASKREDGMASPDTIERQRGIKEAGQQVGVLRERWPLAFPVQAQDVRPLALGIAGQIAAAMGWSQACFAAGKWRRSTVGPCLPMTNASPLMVRRPKRSTRGRRIWRPSSWRGSKRVTLRRRRPPRPPSRSRRCHLPAATNDAPVWSFAPARPGRFPGHLGTPPYIMRN